MFLWVSWLVTSTYFYVATVEEQLLWYNSIRKLLSFSPHRLFEGDEVFASEGAKTYSILFTFIPLLVVPMTGTLTNSVGLHGGFGFTGMMLLLHML